MESQQVLMALKAAEHLSRSVEHSSANPLSVGQEVRARGDLVW